MRIFYDLHIHSALSPCGDEDMTPNNIVNMALLKGLDAIAVTDHNSCGNVRAVMEAAAGRLLVVPGLEVETAEEVHVLCYFSALEQAEQMWDFVRQNRLPVRNKPEIFGRQLYLDHNDAIVGEEEYLLVAATKITIGQVFCRARELGGVPVPAHIDRSSYSVLSNLGFLPPELNAAALEITAANRTAWAEKYRGFQVITNSDAHYLGDISEAVYHMDITTKTENEILEKLTNKKC